MTGSQSQRRWRRREPARHPEKELERAAGQPPRPEVAIRVRRTEPWPTRAGTLGVKRYRPGGVLDRLRRRLGISPARREWRIANRLLDRGLDVPVPVALGEAAGGDADDVYLFEWCDEARDLQAAVLGGLLDARQRRVVARALGGAVRRFHATGHVHRDLHAGNVIVRADGSLLVADLHRARRAWLRRGARQRADLLSLGHFFHGRARASERLRFLKAYGLWPARRGARHRLLRRLDERGRSSLLRFLRHHERRCLGGGRAFTPLAVAGFRGAGALPHAPAVLALLGDDPEETVQRVAAPLHSGGAARLFRFAPTDPAAPFSLAVKVYRDPGPVGLLKVLTRGSRARRAWRALHGLGQAGVRVPEPVLFLEEAALSRRRRSVLVTRFEEGRPDLGAYLARLPAALALPLLQRLAGQIARAHDAFLRNRDLKAENLLVDEEHAEVIWLDPDGVRRLPRLDGPTVARDLMRLNASFPDPRRPPVRVRARVLGAYLRARQGPAPAFQPLLRATCRLSYRKWLRAAAPPR